MNFILPVRKEGNLIFKVNRNESNVEITLLWNGDNEEISMFTVITGQSLINILYATKKKEGREKENDNKNIMQWFNFVRLVSFLARLTP